MASLLNPPSLPSLQEYKAKYRALPQVLREIEEEQEKKQKKEMKQIKMCQSIVQGGEASIWLGHNIKSSN